MQSSVAPLKAMDEFGFSGIYLDESVWCSSLSSNQRPLATRAVPENNESAWCACVVLDGMLAHEVGSRLRGMKPTYL